MSSKLNRAAYERLIAENIAWLDAQPHSLEREHIRAVLRQSPDHEYSDAEERIAAAREQSYERALANVASILRLARERGGTVHLTRGAGYEEVIDEVDKLIAAAVPDDVTLIAHMDQAWGMGVGVGRHETRTGAYTGPPNRDEFMAIIKRLRALR